MRRLFFIALTVSLFASCEKNNETAPSVTKPNYFPLEIGNYWIYEHVEIDSSGNETKLSMTDSIVIKRDTLINGEKYFILEGNNNPYMGGHWMIVDILRDSSGYIINNEGVVRFSADNFADTLARRVLFEKEDTLYTLSFRMEKTEIQISVPAGTFDVLNFRGTLNLYYYNADGLMEILRKYENKYFAENTGKILDTYNWYNQRDKYFEKRLVRYHVNIKE